MGFYVEVICCIFSQSFLRPGDAKDRSATATYVFFLLKLTHDAKTSRVKEHVVDRLMDD